jgi:hypothetical protein
VIERKENTMRVGQAQAKRGPRGRLMGAVMGLAFVAGVFLSLVAPTELDTAEAAGLVSSTPQSVSPGEAIADRDTLDLQLD